MTQKIFFHVEGVAIFTFFALLTGANLCTWADALHSPSVGGVMLTATAATTLYCARKVQRQLDNSKIPFFSFLVIMQPIHLAIGLVEGLATAGVISFIWNARPEILDRAMDEKPLGALQIRNVLIGLLMATALSGGVLARYATLIKTVHEMN